MALSYPISSWLGQSLALKLYPLRDLPQSLNRKHRRVHGGGVRVWGSVVVRQARGNGSMIAIGHANDEVGIWPSANANELDQLPVQRMVEMGDRHPFRRRFAKRGSVL